jgi:ABC-type multidrug transport system fused ATPase/permease subunit
MLLYAKISKMTNYVIKNSELGKITNLLSSDFVVIEQRLGLFLNSFNFPIVMIGCTILLIIRLGWPGVLGIVMVLLIIPISNAISRNNGSII